MPVVPAMIDPVLGAVLGASVAYLGLRGWQALRVVRNAAAWRRATQRLGLRQTADTACEGTCDGFRVDVVATEEGGTIVTQVTIGVPDAPEDLQIRPRASDNARFGLGDPAFDHVVALAGDPLDARSVLHGRTRVLVLGAVRRGWTLDAGQWIRRAPGANLDTLLDEGLALAHAVSTGGKGRLRRLADQVLADGDPYARAEALELLAKHAPDTPALAQALAVAHRDTHGALALAAALIERHPSGLAQVALAATNSEARTQAVIALATRHANAPTTGPTLARLAAQSESEPLSMRQALVSALIAAGASERETGLLQLARDGDRRVAIPALEALAEHGSLAAVARLLPLQNQVLGGPIASAARAAIASIQARAPHADHGALALAEADDGALALVMPAHTPEGDPEPPA